MRYTPIVRGLLSGFYDDKKHKIKLPKGVSIKFVKKSNLEGHRFQICFKGTPVSPELYSHIELNGDILTVQTLGTAYIDIDLKKMEMYPEYFHKLGSVALGRNNKAYFVQKDGSFLELPYTMPYNIHNVKANQSKTEFDNLVVLQNSKGIDALYDAKTLKQIISFEMKGMISIEAGLGSGADGDGEMVYLIKSNEQSPEKDEKIHLLNKSYTYSFYSSTGRKIDEISNASIMWKTIDTNDGKNITKIAFKTGKDKMIIVHFDNNKSKIIQKTELPLMQKSIGTTETGIYSDHDIVHTKSGATMLVTQQQFDDGSKHYGLQKINADGSVEKLLENAYDMVELKKDDSGVYADYKKREKENTEVGRLSLEGKKHTFSTSVAEFSSLSKKFFGAKSNLKPEQEKADEKSKISSDSKTDAEKGLAGAIKI